MMETGGRRTDDLSLCIYPTRGPILTQGEGKTGEKIPPGEGAGC